MAATMTSLVLEHGEHTRAEAVVAAAMKMLLDSPFSVDHEDGVVQELRIIALSPARIVVARAAPALINVAAVMLLDSKTRSIALQLLSILATAWGETPIVSIYGDEGWRLSRPIEMLCTTLPVVWPLICKPDSEAMHFDLLMTIVVVARISGFFGHAPVALAVDRDSWVGWLKELRELSPSKQYEDELDRCTAVLAQTVDITRKVLKAANDGGNEAQLKGLMADYNECQTRFEGYLEKLRELVKGTTSTTRTISIS